MLRLSSYLDHMQDFGFYSHFQRFQLFLNTFSFGGPIIQFPINQGLKSCPNFQIWLIGKSINPSVLPLSPFSKPFITSLEVGKFFNLSTLPLSTSSEPFLSHLLQCFCQLLVGTFLSLSVLPLNTLQ